MIYDFLVAVGGIFMLMFIWLGVQKWVRRNSPNLSPDCDVLESRVGCHGCSQQQDCALKNSVHK